MGFHLESDWCDFCDSLRNSSEIDALGTLFRIDKRLISALIDDTGWLADGGIIGWWVVWR